MPTTTLECSQGLAGVIHVLGCTGTRNANHRCGEFSNVLFALVGLRFFRPGFLVSRWSARWNDATAPGCGDRMHEQAPGAGSCSAETRPVRQVSPSAREATAFPSPLFPSQSFDVLHALRAYI